MTPAAPHLSATVLVVRDDPLEVLMVRRPDLGSFPGALVFPGGQVDPGDGDERWAPLLTGADGLSRRARALRIAAFRETWEETGLLIGGGPARGDGGDFRSRVAASGVALDLGLLVPFGHWITPESAPRRWDTHFFLAPAPAGQVAAATGGETIAVHWLSPREAIEAAGVSFPTRMNLRRLGESRSLGEAVAAARGRGIVTVTPVIERRDGIVTAIIPEAAGYGVTEDRRI